MTIMLSSRPMRIAALTFAILAPSLALAADAESLKVGEPAPPFVLKTMNPKQSGVPQYALRDRIGPEAKAGKKAVVLSFAASYCEPCKRELAELKGMKAELEAAYAELAIVVIDTEPEGIAAMQKLTVDELSLPYPILSDRFGVLARRYHATALPMTVVIGTDGNVRYLSSGFAEGALDKLRAELGIKK
jgi:peroxiredoxin